MPHDVNGRLLKVGDTVNLPCKVTSVYASEDACNVNLETVHPLHPGTHKSSLTLNSKQCCWVESAPEPSPEPTPEATVDLTPTESAPAGS